MSNKNKNRTDTNLTTAGREPKAQNGAVNAPVYHASTIVFPTVADLETAQKKRFDSVYYGIYGTPTSFAFEEAVCALEGANHAITVASGLAAQSCVLTALLSAGDHLLMVDSAYGPTRKFCDSTLKRFGVETTYYDPLIGGNVASLMRPNTKVVFTESPGSITFEVQDIPAIAKAAHDGGALVVMDNTWGAGYFFKAFEAGVDVSTQAATKYIAGQSDTMLGTIAVRERKLYDLIKTTTHLLGFSPQPDDCYRALSGMRTLATRLKRHEATGLELARWMTEQNEVEAVLHPALESFPGHALWKRDFTGSNGLFGVVFKDTFTVADRNRMMDGFALFAIGYSWGGFESLCVHDDPAAIRTATTWPYKGPYVRFHAGLEDVEDLRVDLEAGLSRLRG